MSVSLSHDGLVWSHADINLRSTISRCKYACIISVWMLSTLSLSLMSFFVCFSVAAVFAASNFRCPSDESTGYFADPDQCDKYWDCNRGVASEAYCEDGLAFSERARRSSNPCVNHWETDCDFKTLREYRRRPARRGAGRDGWGLTGTQEAQSANLAQLNSSERSE